MRAGHAAGRAHLAEGVAGLELVAHLAVHLAQVAVHGEQAAAVVEPDRAAVEEIVAHVDHAAGQRRDDGGARRCGDVHAAVRIAGLTIEDAAQAERAGAASRHRHAHVQIGGARKRFAERGHDLLLVVALALVAGVVFGREIDGLGRDLEALLGVFLAAHLVVERARALVGLHAGVMLTHGGRKRDADDRRPFDHVAQHEHLRVARQHLGALRRGTKREARHAARHAAVARPERRGSGIGFGIAGSGCESGQGMQGRRGQQ